MDDATPKKDPAIDLSSLDGLTLGTAWSESSSKANAGAPRESRPPFARGDRPARRFDGPRPGSRPPFRRDDRNGPSDSRGPRRTFERREPLPAPPSIKVLFYPEETPFKALTKAIKASLRTYELFEISRLILEKPERAVATLSKKPNAEGKTEPFYQSIADEALFLTEVEALEHASKSSLDKFFKIEEVETEAPKGNFVVIHRCGVTGKLIAPPNYHKYAQLLAEHQAKNCPTMSIAAVQARLETVKEPEQIAAWLESMKKSTRYTLLVAPEGQEAQSFDSEDAAKTYLSTHFKDQLVKAVAQPRLNAKQLETLPAGEIKRSIDVTRAMQLKFPLETTNNLRGRLRRMNFTIYKRGTKGVSYLSAVKRKFRAVGQAFAPEVQRVIEFIEKTPNITDVELPKQLLGISSPTQPQKAISTEETSENIPATAPVSTLSPEEEAALRQLRQTLQWLIEQGYVIQYGNGTLYVPPARQPNEIKADEEEEGSAEEAAPATETDSATKDATSDNVENKSPENK